MNYVGIDHHRQYSHMTVMDQMGQVLRSGRVPNLQDEIEKFLDGFGSVEAVIEPGRSSYTMVDVLEELGVTVKIAHPNEVRAIARVLIFTLIYPIFFTLSYGKNNTSDYRWSFLSESFMVAKK